MEENEDFRPLILRICDRISDFEALKYQCKDDIGRGKMEKIKSALELFTVLEERDRISADNVDFLIKILTNIRRKDLVKHVQAYKNKWLSEEMLTFKTFSDYEEPAKLNAVPFSNPEVSNYQEPEFTDISEPTFVTQQQQQAQNESESLDPLVQNLITFVSERLSHNWQVLARYLNVPDGVISQSVYNYHHNMKQQIVESLSWWGRNGNGTVPEMINAARQSQKIDLAEAIETHFLPSFTRY